jgi:hypothetical protein
LCAHIPALEISLFASLLKFMRFQLIPNYRKQMPSWCAVLVTSVEILGHFSLAHNRFQKFLEISKLMCVSLFEMQPKFLAAQRQEVGAKFSPT